MGMQRMLTLERYRKAMGEHAKDWPDSKVEEIKRRADILADIVIDMYLAGRAPGPLAEARAVVPDGIGDELEERSAIQEYDAHLPRGTAERMAVSDHVRRQRR